MDTGAPAEGVAPTVHQRQTSDDLFTHFADDAWRFGRMRE